MSVVLRPAQLTELVVFDVSLSIVFIVILFEVTEVASDIKFNSGLFVFDVCWCSSIESDKLVCT